MSSAPNAPPADTQLLAVILDEVGALQFLQPLVDGDHQDASILLFSRFKPAQLQKYGFPPDLAAAFIEKCQRILADQPRIMMPPGGGGGGVPPSVSGSPPTAPGQRHNDVISPIVLPTQSVCGGVADQPLIMVSPSVSGSAPTARVQNGAISPIPPTQPVGGGVAGGGIGTVASGSSVLRSPFSLADTGILIAPVARALKRADSKSDSLRDYNEQLARVAGGEPMCWDDNDHNQTRKGDLFGFFKHNDGVEIHRVVRIDPPDKRLASWNDEKHVNRQVLVLSVRLCVIPWTDWVKFSWHAVGSLLGTQRVANQKARVEMIQYINNMMLERIYHQNQIDAAEKIIAAFRDCRWATLLAFPQSGKTYVFFLVACKMLTSHRELRRAVVVCGNAELELAAQLKESKTDLIRSYVQTEFGNSESMIADLDLRIEVFCGADLKRQMQFSSDEACNTLFIWEEAHYAQDRKNLPHRFFENLGITCDGEPSNLEGDRDNYVLTVSATPFSELCNMARHSQKKRLVRLEPTDAYKGPKQFRENIVQFDPNLAHEDVLEQAISDHVLRTPLTEAPKYAIVRVLDSKGRNNVSACIQRATDLAWAHRLYDSETKHHVAGSMQSMDELAVAPECNTVIFIRGMCRMGKRVPKEHVSFVLETARESRTDTLLQGLMGRMFGYHDCMNIRIWISQRIQLAEIATYQRLMENPIQDQVLDIPIGKNVVGCSQEWYPNVPIHVRIAQNDDEDDDPNAEQYEAELVMQAIRGHFASGSMGNGNSADQNDEIREHISQLTADSMDLRNFMKRSSDQLQRTLQEQDVPRRLRDAVDQVTPLPSFTGCSFRRDVQIIVWRCNTKKFTHSLGFRLGDLVLQTRTRVPSPQQKRVPDTTGDETFKTRQGQQGDAPVEGGEEGTGNHKAGGKD